LAVLRHLHESVAGFGILAGHLRNHFGRYGLPRGTRWIFRHLNQRPQALPFGHVGEVDGVIEIRRLVFGGVSSGVGGAVVLENAESGAERPLSIRGSGLPCHTIPTLNPALPTCVRLRAADT